MESRFCVDCLEAAFRNYGIPEIFNSDQGVQFTCNVFIRALRKYPILRISMDGRGRALDNVFVERLWRNVKHENVYLKGYGSAADLQEGLKKYLIDYNSERSHQSMYYSTPDEVYRSGKGGGACIVNKYPPKSEPREVLDDLWVRSTSVHNNGHDQRHRVVLPLVANNAENLWFIAERRIYS